MKTLRIGFALSFAAAVMGAHAQPQKGPPQGRGDVNVQVEIVFGDRDRAIITDYYRSAGGPKSMPPGHAKQLAKKGRLPPGIEKKQLPADLIRRLPPLPRGYDRVVIGPDVVLIEISTETVMDVIRGVVR